MGKNNTDLYYNPIETLSHNCIINMVLADRGCGKTFGWLKFFIEQFKKKGSQFIYLRRTEAQLDRVKDSILNSIIKENIFPDDEFEIRGNEILINKEVMGCCLPLSLAQQYKGSAFPNVEYILYDEFLIEDKNEHYLRKEPLKLLSLMETVNRLESQGKERKVKAILLGNYFTANNPFFDTFKIYPKQGATFIKHRNSELKILIHLYRNEKYREVKAKTDLAKIIQATEYGDYMLKNISLDSGNFIEKMTGNCSYRFCIMYDRKVMGVWWNVNNNKIYINTKIDNSCPIRFSFDTDSHEPNVLLMKTNRNNPNIKWLRFALEHGFVYFETISIKYTILDLFNYL